MSTETISPVFFVDAYTDPVCLKIKGRANYLNCGPLNDFFARITKKNVSIIIDFEECIGMDSTFLGLLAGVALELKQSKHKGDICLHNLKGRNLELVENLGLNRILKVSTDQPTSPKTNIISPKKLEILDDQGSATPEAILKAHQNLVRADSSNLHKFQDVLSFLKKQVDQDS